MPLSMTSNKTALFSIAVVQPDGVTPVNVTGMDIFFHAGLSPVLTKHVGAGITVTNAAQGLATLQIDPADTSALPANITTTVNCELTLQNGTENIEIYRTTLVIYPDVATP